MLNSVCVLELSITEMKKFEEENLLIFKPCMIEDKNHIIIYPENYLNLLAFKNIVIFNFYFNIIEPSNDNEYNIFFISAFHKLYNKVREMYGIRQIYNYKAYDKYINYFYNLNEVLNVCKDFGNERNYSCFTVRKG